MGNPKDTFSHVAAHISADKDTFITLINPFLISHNNCCRFSHLLKYCKQYGPRSDHVCFRVQKQSEVHLNIYSRQKADNFGTNKTNSTNLYPPTKGYLRETCKSHDINPIYLTLSSPSVLFKS